MHSYLFYSFYLLRNVAVAIYIVTIKLDCVLVCLGELDLRCCRMVLVCSAFVSGVLGILREMTRIATAMLTWKSSEIAL